MGISMLRVPCTFLTGALAVLLPSRGVGAQPQTVPEATKAAAEKAEPEWELEIGGRLFVRDTFTRIEAGDDDVVSHVRGLDLARLFLTHDRKRLRVAFEVDFADGDADLKDTYIRLEPTDLVRVAVGRFKVPMSYLGLTSRWKLPSTERGILSELTAQDRDLPFAGTRGDGISLEVRPPVPLDPRVTIAVFQNPLASAETPLDPREELTQDVYGRASFEPVRGLSVATAFALVGYQEELGVIDSHAEFPMMSLEVELDTEHLRVWAEGFAGESSFTQPDGSVTGSFAAARVLVAGRFGPSVLHHLEPFAGASVLDPTNDVSNDRISEVTGGLNVAFSKYWRIQMEVAHRLAEGAASLMADGTVVRMQLGATFAESMTAGGGEPTRPAAPSP